MRAFPRALLLLAAATLAAPASAAPVQPAREAPASTTIDAEIVAYGQWLNRMIEIEARLQAALGDLGPAWQAAAAEAGGSGAVVERLRSLIARALVTADAAIAEMAALRTPELSVLELPEDVRPASIRGEMVTVNREIRAVIEGLNPVLDAVVANDPAAAEMAAAQVFASLRLIFESQITLARASLASAPSDDAAWELANFELLYSRVGARMFRAFRPFEAPAISEELPRDMLALAAELESNARSGEEKIDAELVGDRAALAEAERRGGSDEADMLRKAIAIGSATRDYLAISRDLAALLRAEAPNFRGRPVAPGQVIGVVRQLQSIQASRIAMGRRIAAAMAATD